MLIERREFIKSVGIGLASLILTQCTHLPFRDDPYLTDLRDCWLDLPSLAKYSWKDTEQGEEHRLHLLKDHRTALNRLVRLGEITSPIAEQLQVAYREASFHIWRKNSGTTCYLPAMGPDYKPTSRDQLTTQAEILVDLSESGAFDYDTVARAQYAIERDIAFLNLSGGEVTRLYDQILEAVGDTRPYPNFDDINLELPAESTDAARFLVELLLDIPAEGDR
jgi:hypothetical protein